MYFLLEKVCEELGFELGRKAIHLVCKKDTTNKKEKIDVIRYICKEFWKFVFKSVVDKVKINHPGIYIYIYV